METNSQNKKIIWKQKKCKLFSNTHIDYVPSSNHAKESELQKDLSSADTLKFGTGEMSWSCNQ
jgi:hypothetical protein